MKSLLSGLLALILTACGGGSGSGVVPVASVSSPPSLVASIIPTPSASPTPSLVIYGSTFDLNGSANSSAEAFIGHGTPPYSVASTTCPTKLIDFSLSGEYLTATELIASPATTCSYTIEDSSSPPLTATFTLSIL